MRRKPGAMPARRSEGRAREERVKRLAAARCDDALARHLVELFHKVQGLQPRLGESPACRNQIAGTVEPTNGDGEASDSKKKGSDAPSKALVRWIGRCHGTDRRIGRAAVAAQAAVG